MNPTFKTKEGGGGNNKKKKPPEFLLYKRMALEGFIDTYHHLAVLQLGALVLHCYLQPGSVLPRKGQHAEAGYTKQAHKGQAALSFLTFLQDREKMPISVRTTVGQTTKQS